MDREPAPERKAVRTETEAVELPDGRTLTLGQDFTIAGERGAWYRFLRYVATDSDSWVDARGGRPEHEKDRSFHLDRIRKIRNSTTPRT